MKRGWIIMCILVFGIVGCKDFLNLVPKNKRVVANLEDVKTELLTYLAAITYSTGGLSPSYGGSVFRFPLYNDVATQLCLYEDDMNMSYYSDHSSIEEKAMNVYTECIDWKGVSLASVLWEKCYGAIGFLNVILDDLLKPSMKRSRVRLKQYVLIIYSSCCNSLLLIIVISWEFR